jgi:ABC-type Fe3+ transport system substrate-binding protein
MGFTQAQLESWYGPGEPVIGVTPLYDRGDPASGDPGQYYLGNALSGFGIVFNRDVLAGLGVPEPNAWSDLADPRLSGWVALADPRMSGSVATTYESILYASGWERGWRLLRALGANARYFTNTSQKVPLDVSQGQAAAGSAIDFYGRFQSQSLLRPGEPPDASRVGYVDPPGETLIDPDPVSLLRAGPNPRVARRFVEFVMSDEGQALWNFPVRPATPRADDDGLGPRRHALRRLPVRRAVYARYADRMVDRVDPYAIASAAPNQGWRSAIGVMMGAFAIDVHDEMRAAWNAINDLRARGGSQASLDALDAMFFSWPEHVMRDGSRLPFTEANYKAIRADWRDAERDGRMTRVRLAYTEFFRAAYARVQREAALAP